MDNHRHPDHAPAKPEVSHPLLWTAGLVLSCAGLAGWFIYWFGAGVEEARTKPVIKLATAGAVEPDHAKLIAERGDAVIERGGKIYGQNCASCHGQDGAGIGQARSFTKEAFRNDLGNGPYAFYSVLVKGYGAGMPPFRGLSPEDKYAVIHYVRESFMRGKNPAFAEADRADVKIPAPGAAGPDKAPAAKPIPLEPMLAGIAKVQGDAVAARLRAQVAAAAPQLDPAAAAALRALAEAKPASAVRLIAAAAAGDRDGFDRLALDADGRGTTVAAVACLDGASRDALFTILRRVATSGGT